LSGGTGNTLPTVSGNNQGVLATPPWPSDNSQWVGFGSAVTAAIVVGIPVPDAAAAIHHPRCHAGCHRQADR
jgi:hypothetical protein